MDRDEDSVIDEEVEFAEAILSFLGKHENDLRERGVDVDGMAEDVRRLIDQARAAKVQLLRA